MLETLEIESPLLIEKLDIREELKDYMDFPWPYDDASIKEILCTGVLEYVPGKLRGQFMDEAYRVLIPEGKMTVLVPYWNADLALVDFRYEWPPFSEKSFMCFNKQWREANLRGTELYCDFDFTYGYAFDPDTETRNEQVQSFQVKRYTNSVQFMQLAMTKRKQDGS